MRRTTWMAVAFVAALVTGIATHAAAPPVTPKIEFEKYTLKNGLDVILVEDHRLPLVAVDLWYHVGPANERAGRTGFAHLFEHMMFQGSKNVGDDMHLAILEGAGASDLNGTTDFDRTNYFETVPSNQLELALWLESDRMGFLLETLDSAKLENQRDVVRNERRQSYENQPYGLARETLFHNLFPKGHPYYASVIGSHADIEAAQLDDVRGFFKQYYVPNNASLAIVGDIDKAKTRALIEKYFGPIVRGAAVPSVTATQPVLTAEKRVNIGDKVQLPRVYMAWHSAPFYKPGDAEADLLSQILSGSKASRLYQKLVYEKQIAQDVSASQESLTLGSVFTVMATARPGVALPDLEKAIEDELDRMRNEGPTAAEIERARNSTVSSLVRGLESLGGFGGVADRLNQYNHYLGSPDYLGKDIGRYYDVTAAGIQKVARDTLKKNTRVVLYVQQGEKVIDDTAKGAPPANTAAPQTTPKDWRATQPPAGPAPKINLPVPQRFALANGLTVLLLEQHKLPVVSANVIVLAGSETNPVNKPGLASFTADMLDEGTAKRSALQISSAAEQIGAVLGGGSGPDSSNTLVRFLKPNADAAFDLLADITLNPAFPTEEVERVRKTRLTSLLQQRDNPNAIAARTLYQVIYGPQHPYGYTEIGTEASTQGTTRDDLQAFWRGGFTPDKSALVIAGDMTLAEARSYAQKYFGSWQGGAVATARAPLGAGESTARFVVVDRGASPQTMLRFGEPGVARSSPDYVPIEVMNTILGGMFSSRINLNLREQHGYSYGASSGFAFRRGPGPFQVATSVRADVSGDAVKEIFKEIEGIRSGPVKATELTLAKDSFSRSLPALFETSVQSAASVGSLFVYGLPLDYYGGLPATIQAVNSADVQRVATQYLTPDKLTVVAVGDKSKLEPELKALNRGPVEVRAPQ